MDNSLVHTYIEMQEKVARYSAVQWWAQWPVEMGNKTITKQGVWAWKLDDSWQTRRFSFDFNFLYIFELLSPTKYENYFQIRVICNKTYCKLLNPL